MINSLPQSGPFSTNEHKSVAIIVAHPDDETLWAGGTILSHPAWKFFIVCLCRKSDVDRSVKFYKTLKLLNAEGIMGELDDGPEQIPLDGEEIETLILDLLPPKQYDLIITHSPSGEYTRHLRHEEVSSAVCNLWLKGKIATRELWNFAYEDGKKQYYPKAIENASVYYLLNHKIWLKKYSLMTETYGYGKNSWEAKTAPLSEAFWKFSDPYAAKAKIIGK